MSVLVKICGLNEPGPVAAAIGAGADMVGFVFFPPSPRAITIDKAVTLVAGVPAGVDRVGLFVNPSNDDLDDVLGVVALDLVQLHGDESPARVREIRNHTKLPVIKALKVGSAADIDRARDYDGIVDWLMFDAQPPRDSILPGGNGRPFDWTLMAGRKFRRPWILSGGLNADNLAEAVRQSGASAVDVSSGVEDGPGRKSLAKIRAFLDAARRL